MEDLKKTILNTIQKLDDISTLFYQQKTSEGFQTLNEALNNLIQVINLIISYQQTKNEVLIEEQIINVVLKEAVKAIEQKDTILLADLLVFEINELLSECLNRI